ncbi:MAG: FAD-binding oxidoreductase [Paenibacillaceae bacterium]
MHTSSYWAKTSNTQRNREQLAGSVTTDVVIVGAGFTGLATSYYLQKLGYKTVVLDEHCVGWGGSGRNGSLMLVGYKHSLVAIAKKYGIEAAKEMLHMSLDGINLVKEIVENHQIACDLTKKGSFCAAFKPSHFEGLKKEQEFMMKHLDYENYIVDAKNSKQEVDSPLYHGGLIDPNSHYFHPLNYAIGLADAVESVGGVIYEQSPAISISRQQNRVTVSTPQGQVEAKELVIATNGYTSPLVKKLYKSVIPVKSFMIATNPLDPKVADSLIPNRRGVFDTKKWLYYFRLSTDNRLLFGGRVDFRAEENDKLFSTLRGNMLEVFPQLQNSKIDLKWGGNLALTMDMFPHIGRTEDGTHFALGYSGHGVSLSTLMGKLLALNIHQKDRKLTTLEKLPLKEVPLHGQRFIVLNIVGSYFRFLDLVS